MDNPLSASPGRAAKKPCMEYSVKLVSVASSTAELNKNTRIHKLGGLAAGIWYKYLGESKCHNYYLTPEKNECISHTVPGRLQHEVSCPMFSVTGGGTYICMHARRRMSANRTRSDSTYIVRKWSIETKTTPVDDPPATEYGTQETRHHGLVAFTSISWLSMSRYFVLYS